MTVSEAFADRH